MGRILFALFMIVPIIEIGLFITLGQWIGLWPTLLGVVVTALIGSAIIRVQGINVIADIQRTARAGGIPAQQLAEGMMIGIAGALLLTPGYFTDTIGFLLLVPPIRLNIYNWLKSKFVVVSSTAQPRDPRIIDLDDEDWRG